MTCDCAGGMRFVTDVYARQEAGIGRDEDVVRLEQLADEEARQRLHELRDPEGRPREVLMQPTTFPNLQRWERYRAHLASVFPCPRCAPVAFDRWRNGCYRPNHQRKSCSVCGVAA